MVAILFWNEKKVPLKTFLLVRRACVPRETAAVPRSSRLSFELLETFVRVIDNDGIASVTARQLCINQASMSKRLAQLHNVGPVIRRPWLSRVGKRWRLTDEGQKLLPAAQDLVRRYDRLRDALEDAKPGLPPVTFACGQQTVGGFVCDAVAKIQRRHPEIRLRIATLRGRARIEGVVNGSLDLALVGHRPETIQQVAGRPLYVEPIFEDPFALVAGRSVQTAWARRFAALPEGDLTAEQVADFPLILPEPEADARRQLERIFRDAGVCEQLDIVLEIGGWPAVLTYARRGVGAGIVPRSALVQSRQRYEQRLLDPQQFAPLVMHLICRRLAGTSPQADLTPNAALFARLLREAAGRGQQTDGTGS
jgi:DNA-binding transcriptional LysR family regulator